MSYKIEGTFKGHIDVKRFHMPGVVASDECPKCAKTSVLDFTHDYLPYPVVGKPVLICFYCEDCDQDWQQKANIAIQVTALQENK